MAREGVPHKRRIAIVGAGCSGLAAIKSCLDEDLEPVCMEKSTDLGGLWNFSTHVMADSGSIYSSLVINTSKYMMMFSDFPPPDDFPPFLAHSKVLDYFRLYAQHFLLTRHILFNTQVLHVSKSLNYDSDGKWDVMFVRNPSTDVTSSGCEREADVVSETFDGVMICTGHHSVPYLPTILGLDEFQGSVLHSHSYKDSGPFVGKKVLILGFGNSAVDIACDLARSAQEVCISSRRGTWIVPRTAFWGLPADMLANSRLVFTLPYRLLDWCVQLQANFRVDHVTYGLKPAHGVLNCHPTINDELPIHLVSGRVQTRPNIKYVVNNRVWFEDHSSYTCDVIILATGYDYRVDVVDSTVLKLENNKCRLYKYVFPPNLPHPTLAVIGLVQSIGAAMPISEMQSRWFARIMAGTVTLPSRKIMEEDIRVKEALMSDLYVKSRRHTLQTFWIDYMDQVASLIGVRPSLWKLFCSDPELALKCYMGPCLPTQYRLTGPGAWSGARQFIVSALTQIKQSRSAIGSRAGRVANRETERRAGGRTHETQWATLAFYLIMMVICLFAWLFTFLFNKAQSVLNAVERQLPVTD